MKLHSALVAGVIACACTLAFTSVHARTVHGAHERITHATTAAALSWGWGNPQPSGDEFQAVAFGNGTYVAAGTGGMIYSGTNTGNLTRRATGFGTDFSYFDVVFGGGKFVAGGTDGSTITHISMSQDGSSWTSVTPKLGTGEIATHLGYGNGTFVAVNNVALTSTDGVNWTRHTIESTSLHPFFDSPVYANGVFTTLGIDDNGLALVYYSSDGGNTWHKASLAVPNTSFLNMIVTDGHSFVLTGVDETVSLGSPAGIIYTSTDGNHWTLQALAAGDEGFEQPVFWTGSHYVTGSDTLSPGASMPVVYTSPDGITWTQGGSFGIHVVFAGSHHPIIWDGHDYVGTYGGSLAIQTSSALATWNKGFDGTTGNLTSFGSVADLNGQFIATGPKAGGGTPSLIMASSDGIHWKDVLGSGHGTGGLYAGAYGDGTYVVLGDAHSGFTSQDGVSWTAMNTPPADAMDAVAFGKGKFVGVGFICVVAGSCSGRVDTSTDGKTWTFQDISSVTGDDLTGVAFTGSEFIAVTDNLTNDGTFILKSTDGVSWSAVPVSFPAGAHLAKVHWLNNKLVAVGYVSTPSSDDPFVATSTDGTTWNSSTVDAPVYHFSDVTYDGADYYACSGNGLFGMFTSTDAKSWSFMDKVPGSAQINSLAAAGTRVAAAGNSGQLMAGEMSAPTVSDGSVTTTTGQAVTGTLSGSGSNLAFSLVAQPAHGTAVLTDAATGAFKYTPKAGFKGADSFTFQVSDGIAQSSAATESITVSAGSGGGGGSGGGYGSGGGGGAMDLASLLLGLALLRRKLRSH